jgi:TolA-binding protein
MSRGRTEEAEAAFRKALEVEARTAFAAEAALYLGDLATAAGRAEEARTFHEKAASMASSDDQLSIRARAYAGLGRAAMAAGEMGDAARYFMGVAILYEDPELVPECLAGAVKAFLAQGQTASAREAARELKERYPASREATSLPVIPEDASGEVP